MSLLLNYAIRTTGNADDAKDLLQDTYLKAFRFIDKYEKGTNAKAWLFRIMKNSFINDYRKSSRLQIRWITTRLRILRSRQRKKPATEMTCANKCLTIFSMTSGRGYEKPHRRIPDDYYSL